MEIPPFQADAGVLTWLRSGLLLFLVLHTASCSPILGYIFGYTLGYTLGHGLTENAGGHAGAGWNRGQEGNAADRKAYEDEMRQLAGKLDPKEQERVERLYRESPGSLRAEEMATICRSSNVNAGQGLHQHERFVACMEGNGFSWVGAEWVKRAPPPSP
jgi:hypothetical protein